MSFVPVDLAQEARDADEALKTNHNNNAINDNTDTNRKEDDDDTNDDDDNNNNNNDLSKRIAQSIYNHLIERVGIDISSNLHELIKTGDIPMAALTQPFTRQELYPELYHNQNDDTVQETLNKYATEVPIGSQFARRQKKRRHEEFLLQQQQQQQSMTTTTPTTTTSTKDSSDNDGNSKKKSDVERSTPVLSLSSSSSPLPHVTVDNSVETEGLEPATDAAAAAAAAASPTMQTRQTTNHLDIWGRVPPKEPKHNVECRICGRPVSALKFAPHLDRCMGLSMSRNGGGG